MALRNLARSLASQVKAIEDRTAKRVNQLALDIVTDAARSTPVDTSQAASNWIVGIGAVDPSFIGPWVPGAGGSTKAESLQVTISLAKLMLEGRKFGVTIYISNSAPYIRKLNRGHSKQAPAGFIEAAVMRQRNRFNGR